MINRTIYIAECNGAGWSKPELGRFRGRTLRIVFFWDKVNTVETFAGEIVRNMCLKEPDTSSTPMSLQMLSMFIPKTNTFKYGFAIEGCPGS